MPRRVVLALAAVVVLLAAGLVAWRIVGPGSGLERALSMAPADTSRASWTDWAAVRRELGADVDAGSSGAEVEAFLSEAFAEDLSSMSALGTSAGVMQDELGFSPATLSWELLAQSQEGALAVMGVDEEVRLDDVAHRLAALGWTEPDEEDGVWVGGPDVLSRVGSMLTPELQHVAILADQAVIVASDQAPFLEDALDVVRGERDGADDLADLAGELDDPLVGVAYDGAYACEHLAMAQADEDAQAEADQLVSAAGGVHPLTGFAMGRRAGSQVRVVMQVEDDEDAPGDAEARATLASGPAPGQGGEFGERFAVERARSEGRSITLDLRPRAGEYVLSDLTSGPVLFATC